MIWRFSYRVLSLLLAWNLGAPTSLAVPSSKKSSSEISLCESMLLGLNGVSDEQVSQLMKSPKKFEQEYPAFQVLGKEQNKALIKVANNPVYPNSLAVVGEIPVLKELNDEYFKEKDLVTKIIDVHKEVYIEELLRPENKEIHRLLNLASSDFKSLRFIYRDTTTVLIDELDRVLIKANERFYEMLKASGLIERSKHMRGLLRHPQLWFLMGMGHTVDEAGVAARSMRKIKGPEELYVRHFQEIEANLDKTILQIEQDREKIQKIFSRYPAMLQDVPGAPGKKALSRFVIKVLIKTKPEKRSLEGLSEAEMKIARAAELQDYLQLVKTRLGKAYNFDPKDIFDDDAYLLKRYISELDQLAPGILVEERVVINLTKAEKYVVTMDFAGLNVWNFEQSQFALARDKSGSGRQVLKAIRAGEQIATNMLVEKMNAVRTIFYKVFGTKSFFTGDDGATFPKHLTDWQKAETVERLIEEGEPDTFRLAFGIKDHGTVEAELIEKAMRLALEGHLILEEQHQIILAVDLTKFDHKGQVVLWTGGQMTDRVYAKVESVFQEVLILRNYTKKQRTSSTVKKVGPDHSPNYYPLAQ